MQQKQYDRGVEDLGNIVGLEHVNVLVPDQRLATLFYITGLGLTRDPYLMTSVDNMWANVGRSQFHLITGPAQVLRGRTGLVVPDRAALLKRLEKVKPLLEGTKFAYSEHDGYVDATCPWGNRIRLHTPEPRFGRINLGMPYVEFDVPPGTSEKIAKFYQQVMGAPAWAEKSNHGDVAHVPAGPCQELMFRETTAPIPPYDKHHIQVYVANFSGPHRKLLDHKLVTEESDQHQYRFQDIIDVDTGKPLFTIEHEVRSMRHPLYARPLVNRNPAINNRNFMPGHEAWAPAEGIEA